MVTYRETSFLVTIRDETAPQQKSTFPLWASDVILSPYETPGRTRFGTKSRHYGDFWDTFFGTLFGDMARALEGAMEEWCFPLGPPGPLPPLI